MGRARRSHVGGLGPQGHHRGGASHRRSGVMAVQAPAAAPGPRPLQVELGGGSGRRPSRTGIRDGAL